jgi:hypothetical protein
MPTPVRHSKTPSKPVGRPRRGWTRKNVQIDQRKLDAARKLLGTATETDTIDAALDAITFRHGIMSGIRHLRSAGGITDVYAE